MEEGEYVEESSFTHPELTFPFSLQKNILTGYFCDRVPSMELRYEIVTESGCWIFLGNITKQGYGRVKRNGRKVPAHRVSYELHKGQIPEGKFVCHKCDVRCCVNPDHLFVGTHQANMADMVKKGRHHPEKYVGEKNRAGSKLKINDILKIREDPRSHRKIALDFGVSHRVIGKIKKRQDWACVP